MVSIVVVCHWLIRWIAPIRWIDAWSRYRKYDSDMAVRL